MKKLATVLLALAMLIVGCGIAFLLLQEAPPAPGEAVTTEPMETTEQQETTQEPETTEVPEITEVPEVTESETTEPEITKPEITEPEVTEPEVTEPEVTEPEVTEPEVTEPEVTEPPVTEPPAVKLSVSSTSLNLEVGDTATLTASYTGTGTLTWKSGDASVATVSRGKVTAKAAGTAKITVTDGTKTATCTVTVTAPVTEPPVTEPPVTEPPVTEPTPPSAREQAVNAEVKRILDELDLYNASDANKVYGVYRYMCENIKYGDPFDQSLNNVYDALVNKVTICGGYALAFCRLMSELGVNAQYIEGTAYLGGHAWNIVELEGYYYNLDTTWDAGKIQYQYYLKSQENFTTHTRYYRYDTPEFHQKYPMGKENYCGGSGRINDSMSWEITKDKTLVISGQGEMPDYKVNAYSEEDTLAPWYLSIEGIKAIEIQDGITRIGGNCFDGCTALTTVEMADSVTSIGSSAFGGCSSLENVTFSQNVQEIESSAFMGTDLRRVELPQTLESIGRWAFASCEELTEIVLPKTLKEIGSYAFEDCYKLSKVILPEGLETIGDGAFSDCTSLTDIQIPKSVTELGDKTFSGCTALREVTLDYGTRFGEGLFKNCSALEEVNTYPGGMTGFNHATKEMFYGCTSLRSISLSNASVGERAFQDCTSLESVRFEYSGDCEADAFKNCTAIKSVYIDNINRFMSINFSNKEANPLHNGAMLYDENGLVTHIDYSTSLGYYNQYTFYGCQSLTSVYIAPAMYSGTEVGKYTFANCINLKYVTMSDNSNTLYGSSSGCSSIGEGAFMNCTSLEWIELGDNCRGVHETAFLNCGKLNTVYLNADQSRWTALCEQAPALKAAAVVPNAKAPADCIDHQCEFCKRVATEGDSNEDVFMPADDYWGFLNESYQGA